MTDTPLPRTSLEKDLYLGLLENESDKVINALRDGADVNTIYKYGKTHLMIALEHHCNKTIITQLLDVSDVNALDVRKKSALMYALENSYDTDIISLLIDKGADVNAHDTESRTPYDYYLLSSGCGLEVKRILFRAGAFINDNLDKAEINLLKAIERNDIKAVNEVISNGCNIDAVNNVGRSPLIYSLIHHINKEIPLQLINYGAEVNITDQHFLTPLLYALKYKRHKDIIIQLLQNGADVNTRDKKGRTPLIYSIKYNCGTDITEILINIGTDVNLQNNLFKKSPLDYALLNKHPCNIILQLLKAGSDVNKCDSFGRTPLMLVIGNNEYHEIYQKNLIAGVDHHNYEGISRTNRGNLLMESRNSQKKEIYDNIDWEKENISNLLRYGADINKVDAKGNTVLHFDCHIQLVKIFLKHGANIEKKNNEGKTPLMTAALFNNYKRVKVLLLCGADPNSCDENWDTPLHFARDENIVNILIHFGGDINAINQRALTPTLIVFVQCKMFHSVKIAHTTNTLLLFNHSNRIDYLVSQCFASFSRYRSCVEELDKMKLTHIKDDLTFYEFCKFKKSKRKRYIDLSNSQYLNSELYQKLFPNFYSIIKLKIEFNEIEKKRHDLIRDIYKIMIEPINIVSQFESFRLNYDCLDIVCQNLSYVEVLNLFLASVE